MKDKQTEPASGQSRIPILSALLHCVSIPAIVYLRSSFGFAYLRPKSVFFAFSWAFALFLIFAWNEPEIWREYRSVCFFGFGATILYWFHLFMAFTRELYRRGEHDHYSGTSHLLRLVRVFSPTASNLEMNIHLWTEPALVATVGGALRFGAGEKHFSIWLVTTAVCLWFKEAFNYWFQLRLQKRQSDMFADTGETMQCAKNESADTAPKATRTGKKKRVRNTFTADEAAKERRFAEILRLLPPYSLEVAEENYRKLIRFCHPDTAGTTSDSNSEVEMSATDLNEAIQFFRNTF